MATSFGFPDSPEQFGFARIRLLPDDYLSWLTTAPMMRTERWKWLMDSVLAEMKFRDLRYDLATTDEPMIEIPDKPQKRTRKFRLDE